MKRTHLCRSQKRIFSLNMKKHIFIMYITVVSENTGRFIEDQAIPPAYDLAPPPIPTLPLPVSKLDRPHIGTLSNRDNLLMGEGRGWARSQAWPSINHSILSGANWPTDCCCCDGVYCTACMWPYLGTELISCQRHMDGPSAALMECGWFTFPREGGGFI